MLSDDAKYSLLEWLFGKRVLDKAAKQGTETPKPEVPQNTDYVKEQIKKTVPNITPTKIPTNVEVLKPEIEIEIKKIPKAKIEPIKKESFDKLKKIVK